MSVFPVSYLEKLQKQILASPYLSVNNLNRDFVDTQGFSIVFQRAGIPQVEERFPFLSPYLQRVLLPDCNAFYLNPLLLKQGSRVDPHIDRSLRSYCKTIDPPAWVSVLYLHLPTPLAGGSLILKSGKKQVGSILPQVNQLLYFQGNLTHAVTPLKSQGIRLSLVCEQYLLEAKALPEIPEFTLESRLLPRY
ncbi:MAG: 2OG-Fe(II) oxygenase [Cyanobacteriota bacterium]|nr:2OG-Fe(II) oxygenase [Cyanobacteriota bacterium]